MPCALCGCWAYRHKWVCDKREAPDPAWECYYRDERPGRFWYVVCSPNCEVNAVQEAANRLNAWALWYDWEVGMLSVRMRRGIDDAMAHLRRAHGQKAATD